MPQDFNLYMCMHVLVRVCMFMFVCVCVNMQLKHKGSHHLSGWDDGGGVGVDTNTPFVVFLASVTSPAGASIHLVQFGVRAKCVSGLCSDSKVIR